LNLASKASDHEQVRPALLDLEKQVNRGIPLADCTYPMPFPPIFLGLMAARDAVGSAEAAFQDLADLLEISMS
jgi:hypothetical protein